MFMNSEQPFFYFNPSQFKSYSDQIPSSMLQNTLPLTDCQSTANALEWFKNNVNYTAILLTHTAFYGWALLTLNESQVRNYGFDDPATAAMAVAKEGYSQIYLIWWVNGQGWYGQPLYHRHFTKYIKMEKSQYIAMVPALRMVLKEKLNIAVGF